MSEACPGRSEPYNIQGHILTCLASKYSLVSKKKLLLFIHTHSLIRTHKRQTFKQTGLDLTRAEVSEGDPQGRI